MSVTPVAESESGGTHRRSSYMKERREERGRARAEIGKQTPVTDDDLLNYIQIILDYNKNVSNKQALILSIEQEKFLKEFEDCLKNQKLLQKQIDSLDEKIKDIKEKLRHADDRSAKAILRDQKEEARTLLRNINMHKRSFDRFVESNRKLAKSYIKVGREIQNLDNLTTQMEMALGDVSLASISQRSSDTSLQAKEKAYKKAEQDVDSCSKNVDRMLKELGRKESRVERKAESAYKKYDELSQAITSKIQFLNDFGKSTIKSQYDGNKTGIGFLKMFGTRSSRVEQVNRLQSAVDKFKEDIVKVALSDAANFVESRDKSDYLKEFPGKVVCLELQKEIGAILLEIDKEKEEKSYKAGESRLENICNEMCASLGVDVKDVKKLAEPTNEASRPDVKAPRSRM